MRMNGIKNWTFIEEKRMLEEIVNKNEMVKIFYDEDCRKNEEETEWSIPSKIVLLDF